MFDCQHAVQTCKTVLLAGVLLESLQQFTKKRGKLILMSPPAGEAQSIMDSERERLEMPHGMPTFEGVEKERRARGSLGSLLER